MREDFAFSIEVDSQGEVYRSEIAAGPRGSREVLENENAERALDQAMGLIHSCADRISRAVSSLHQSTRPKEVEATFGVKFSTEAGAILAKASTEANIEIKLKWLT